jgi:hypothetical protein
MGWLGNAEKKNSERVLEGLLILIPDHEPTLAEVPCNLAVESHLGIRLGTEAAGYLFLHRCQLKWWARMVAPEDAHKIGGPLGAYTVALAEARPLMSAVSSPADAARTIAHLLS